MALEVSGESLILFLIVTFVFIVLIIALKYFGGGIQDEEFDVDRIKTFECPEGCDPYNCPVFKRYKRFSFLRSHMPPPFCPLDPDIVCPIVKNKFIY